MGTRKHLPVSIHETQNGTLQVDWSKEDIVYFTCPNCNKGKLKHYSYYKDTPCQLQIACDFCHKYTTLSCQLKRRPKVSIHQTLHGTLEVNWKTNYFGEFTCPSCNQGKITKFVYYSKSQNKLRGKCDSCNLTTNLSCTLDNHRISIHETCFDNLQVNWLVDYAGEFICPQCNQANLNRLGYSKGAKCKLTLICDSCSKATYLTCPVSPLPISSHPTLVDDLLVDWSSEYSGEFICPECNKGKITKFNYSDTYRLKVRLSCSDCKKSSPLACEVSPNIHSYRPAAVCPNPSCHETGPHGQKGWIYEAFNSDSNQSNYRCHFCQINFAPNSKSISSWIRYGQSEVLQPFCFDDDVWDFRHFVKKTQTYTINFQEIHLDWFRILVKQYLYFLLKSGVYSASAKPINCLVALRQFHVILAKNQITDLTEISRNDILDFIDLNQSNAGRTLREKLYVLKDFFEYFNLDAKSLVKHRDIPKERKSDVDWLDEITRERIKEHLTKIPFSIACQYLVQEYTAARPGDVCLMVFDCLISENGEWYIKFYQHKVERWHRVPATRAIRQVIEQQQQWIRQTFGTDYSYLFCHFRSITQSSYPNFLNIKPLPLPPSSSAQTNPMVRIIRLLIKFEDVRDINGKRPNFTGKITRSSRLQEIRVKYGMSAAQLYADHKSSNTTFQHYAPPTQEEVANADLPFQELLINRKNLFLPWQSLPLSLLKNPKAHELDIEITPRLVVYGHCTLDPKTQCIYNLYPKCYGCSSFRPSTEKLPLYERQYAGEQQRIMEAQEAGSELAYEEAKATLDAMDKWLPDLRKFANE